MKSHILFLLFSAFAFALPSKWPFLAARETTNLLTDPPLTLSPTGSIVSLRSQITVGTNARCTATLCAAISPNSTTAFWSNLTSFSAQSSGVIFSESININTTQIISSVNSTLISSQISPTGNPGTSKDFDTVSSHLALTLGPFVPSSSSNTATSTPSDGIISTFSLATSTLSSDGNISTVSIPTSFSLPALVTYNGHTYTVPPTPTSTIFPPSSSFTATGTAAYSAILAEVSNVLSEYNTFTQLLSTVAGTLAPAPSSTAKSKREYMPIAERQSEWIELRTVGESLGRDLARLSADISTSRPVISGLTGLGDVMNSLKGFGNLFEAVVVDGIASSPIGGAIAAATFLGVLGLGIDAAFRSLGHIIQSNHGGGGNPGIATSEAGAQSLGNGGAGATATASTAAPSETFIASILTKEETSQAEFNSFLQYLKSIDVETLKSFDTVPQLQLIIANMNSDQMSTIAKQDTASQPIIPYEV